MNPSQALQLLSNALQPQAVGTITRAGYIQIEQALVVQQQRNEQADVLEKEVAELRAKLAEYAKREADAKLDADAKKSNGASAPVVAPSK